MNIDRIIRTKRKSLAIHFTDDGALVVKAPFNISNSYIEKTIAKHRDKLQEIKRKLEEQIALTKKTYTTGEEFFYLGKKYRLTLTEQPSDKPLYFNNGFYLDSKCRHLGRALFITLYMNLGYDYIRKRAEHYSQLMNLSFHRLKITRANRRCGSCSTKGNINFSWRLIMAPPEIVDYVVVHELAHLAVPNHSAAFWTIVQRFCPDYKKRIAWLRANGPMLNLR